MTLFAVLGGCSATSPDTSEPTTNPPTIGSAAKPVVSSEVTVELSSVTLADDCGGGTMKPLPPPTILASAEKRAQPEAKPEAKRAAPEMEMESAKSRPSAGACATPGGCGGGPYNPPCEQTSMQLALHVPAGAQPTTLRVTKVELLDDTNAVVDVLTASKPSRWVDPSYVTWDETVGAGQDLATSYMLSSPNWDKLTKGKWNAHTKQFNLRVTFVVGSAERSVVRQKIQPAMIQPMIET